MVVVSVDDVSLARRSVKSISCESLPIHAFASPSALVNCLLCLQLWLYRSEGSQKMSVSSVSKGNRLENALYNYFTSQRERGEDIYDFCRPDRCNIRHKAKYYCKDREGDVEFDIVIEIYRRGGKKPSCYYVFECKNYASGVSEDWVREFSDKLTSAFGHSAKGVIVVASRLQSGAMKVAENRKIGVAKFDEAGIEVIAERKNWMVEHAFVKRQLLEEKQCIKSLKFSAYIDGKFLSGLINLLETLQEEEADRSNFDRRATRIPFVPIKAIRSNVEQLLHSVGYRQGHVNLFEICKEISVSVNTIEYSAIDAELTPVLGEANFIERKILIRAHNHPFRERFTLAHEIGHFRLGHGTYLLSDTVIEHDLLVMSDSPGDFDYARMEVQANLFASELLLPEFAFKLATSAARKMKGIRDRGFGYIFVDDQPVNYVPYNEIICYLSELFLASKEAVEIRLKSLGLVTDQRTFGVGAEANRHASNLIENFFTLGHVTKINQ
ncbi:ImmA/IrrE family metallo-endopeptidase [Rhizobium rhizosphaerae]|uniref:ImmA/IrrE family metallo-endopeptidase n=1 Tax=Xaviernesmea rhizosphaerae TaxID=1672749 RepID=UPI000ACAE38D|nr:ImmA/IrrE family metallo-endopeptidase [Xaviernesmea rhizosphaerae]